MVTSTSTQVFAVIGHPVAHSLSPAMHSAAIEAIGLDAVYLAFDVRPGQVRGAIEGMRALGFRGLNATIPHKAAVMAFVDEADETARLAGGANTVTNDDGWLVGSSTDGPGFLRSLEEAGVDPRGEAVVLAGSGGGARAIAASLATVARSITVAARNAEARTSIVSTVRQLGATAEGIELSAPALTEALRTCRLLVNCTPLGMWPSVEGCIPIQSEAITPDHVVVDIVPNPAETLLLRRAAERGAKTVDGVGMLVHQGAIAFEKWTGQPAPVQAMRAAAVAALRVQRGGR